jgi:hypothetical protein
MTKRLRVVTALAALSGALLLAGCGEGDVAATVNGTAISEKAAQVAAEQITTNFQLEEPFTTAKAVGALINAPFILEVADATGHGQSEAAARALLTKVPNPSAEAILLVRANVAQNEIGEVDPDAFNQVVEGLQAATITVNPRYGTYDFEAFGVGASTPNWIATGN